MSAIIAPLDWSSITALEDVQAAVLLDCHAKQLDSLSKSLFMQRGLIMLEMDERGLWRLLSDPETGLPYHSFEKWAVTAFDYSRRDCFYAKAAAKELRDIPREQLLAMPRANIALLQSLSPAVRKDKQVLALALNAPTKNFVRHIEHFFPDQHIEQRTSIHVVSDKSEADDVEQAIAIAMIIEECKSRSEALRAVCISYIQDNFVQYEAMMELRGAK